MDAPNPYNCEYSNQSISENAHLETYFNAGATASTAGHRTERQHRRWAYDNFVYANLPFDPKVRRGDRVNIDERFQNIHVEEVAKRVPLCTQSWYGHRKANYDERLTESLGKIEEMKSVQRRNGMPFPQANTFGMEQVENKTLIDIVKPKL